MENIKIIEKAKGMAKEGAIKLLKYHSVLQQTKMMRLSRQLARTNDLHETILAEIERREKETENE